MNSGLSWVIDYTEYDMLLPVSIKIHGTRLADSIVGMRPDETWDQAVSRHVIEQRVKKINKIKYKMKKGS